MPVASCMTKSGALLVPTLALDLCCFRWSCLNWFANFRPLKRDHTPLVLSLDGSVGERLRGCPYIARSGYEYDLANECLEDCFRGAWTLKLLDTTVAATIAGKAKPSAPSSVFQYAHAAANVIAWSAFASTPERPISILNYDEDTLTKYQRMMGKGEWSIDGKELDQGTIENRLMVAISVAEWAHVHGYRGPTDFIRERTASGGWRYALLRTASRFKSYPILSSNFAITFLRSAASDQSYFLCALTITLTGLRISELRSLDVKHIPFEKLKDPTWEGGIFEVIGKGRVPRPVTISRKLVESMHAYLQCERARLLEICARRHGEGSEIYKDAEKALILNSHGRRIASRSTWAAFVKFGLLVGLHVHPHLLRHWFAANRLRKQHERILSNNPDHHSQRP